MNADLRKRPPEPLAPIPFEISKPFEATLSNGLRVVIFENERLPLVSYRLSFFTGDIDESEDGHGLMSAMALLLTEGTENYSSQQLAEKIERLGAGLSARTSFDFTTISASSLSFYTSAIFEMLAEVILKPTFPENEVDLYKRNLLENLKFQRSQPPFLASEQAARLIYGKHPYSQVSLRPNEVESIDREKLLRTHRQALIPNNAVMLIVGDVRREEVIKELEQHLNGWQAGMKPVRNFAEIPTRTARTCTVVDRPGSSQSNIVIANSGFSRLSPDYFPALVMNQVLGAGASSRVFMNLREEKGYTYGAYTRMDARALAGDIEATAEVCNDVTGASISEFLKEFDRIRNEKVGPDELADAQNFLTGVFPIRAETQEGLTTLLLNRELYGLPEDYLQTYRDKVSSVTADEVQDAARKYIRPDEMAIIVVGDAKSVLPQIEEFASAVEVFDTDGKRISD
ncbi:MAG: insulinase family protein [Acidobacteria bacterium]|nr:insulinase family protein [Acidobacteriota bacterium]